MKEDDIFIRAKTVVSMTGLSQTTVYRLAENDPLFPKPIRISNKINVWSKHAVSDWITTKKKLANQGISS
jgi:predicted DNA-binding transcriptional regulator AlpA